MKMMRYFLTGIYFILIVNSVAHGQVEKQLLDPDSINEQLHIDQMDSLLYQWYIQQPNEDNNLVSGIEDDTIEGPELPDSFYIKRLQSINSLIDLPYNSIIRNFIKAYTEKKRDRVEVMLGLTDYYFPMIEEILDMYQLPQELRFLPVIESALNPRAVSRAGATGLWQFMYGTGRMYSLTINSYIDERRDPLAATHAACRFLKDLYAIYGDWTLVIAAYNCGPANVNKAIRRSGGKRNYWDIYYYLPRETRGYVPAFIAASYTYYFYKEHNMQPKPITLPPATDTIMVNDMLHLQQIAEVLDYPVELLRDLNPQYKIDIIPAKGKSYVLRLPNEMVGAFLDREKEIYAYKDSIFFNQKILANPSSYTASYQYNVPPGSIRFVYKVKQGDVLGIIAERYNVTVRQLKEWNNLRGNLIRVGQRLVIYVPERTASRLGIVQEKKS
ncbi:MAG TPA: lytic transglycosylase [Bacteroidales bacterium]|nr:lytic transglycosylase [Bacteroidales bacterium]